MAKNITIDPAHVYVSRSEEMTVKDALAWVEKNLPESEYAPADLLVYGVRRLMALHKDAHRYESGKLAARLYAPRLDALGAKVKVPRSLAPAVETIHAVSARGSGKPARKPAPVAKVA